MKKILMKAMMNSISEVMETMFFLPVEPNQESLLAECGMDMTNSQACRLAFKGDASGSLNLVVPNELTMEMAENFMGESRDNFTDEHLSGTLTEMLNMVCGNALSKTDASVPFELGIPEMINDRTQFEGQPFTIVDTMDSKMAILLKMD